MKRVFAIGFLLAAITSAAAQPYPSRPVTMIVPFGAGGPTDALARIVAQRMSAALGQTVLVENVTGASGTIGIARVARASPDGYTIVLGNWPSFVVASAISSFRLFTGERCGTTSTSSEFISAATGTNSRISR